MERTIHGISTLTCIAAAAIVFALWLLLAGDLGPRSLAEAALVATAAAPWVRLLDD